MSERVLGGWLETVWLLIGILVFFRDDIVVPHNEGAWKVANMIPHISLAWWIAGSFVILAMWAFEASFRLQRKSDVATESLNLRISKLEKEIKPKLRCSFGKNIPGCVVRSVFSGTDTKVDYYRVKLESDFAGQINDCSGHLISLELNGQMIFNHESIALPIAPGERPNPTLKDIRDHVPEYLDVFYIDEYNQISIVWPHGVRPNSIQSEAMFWETGTFVFHIVVSAPSTASCPIDLTLVWDGDWRTAEVM